MGFDNQTILITGGTGTIGSLLAKTLLSKYYPKKVVVISRDETRQHDFINEIQDDRLITYLCDVRDFARLNEVFMEVKPDIVFHAAALKHVIFCEKNPIEAVKTNAIGTYNVVSAAIAAGVKKVIYISTDKAVNPTSVMGSTKLIGERICLDYYGKSSTCISCVRFGNVLSSRGSVFQLFKKQIENGEDLTITHPEMTRFVMKPSQAVDLVLEAAELAKGGEIFILRMPAMKVTDLASAMIKIFGNDKSCKQVIIGIKKGEKLHEELVTEAELQNITELNNFFVVKPGISSSAKKRYLLRSSNPEYLISEEEIIKYIRQMINEQL